MAIPGNTWEQHLFQELRRAGYRLTAARRLIVETLLRAERPLSPGDLYARVRERSDKVGLVTIYRTLETLVRLGVLQRVHQEDGCQGYVFVGYGHRHLAVCRQCGQVVIFEGEDDLTPIVNRLQQETGFVVDGHLLQLVGICAKCRADAPHTEVQI